MTREDGSYLLRTLCVHYVIGPDEEMANLRSLA